MQVLGLIHFPGLSRERVKNRKFFWAMEGLHENKVEYT